MRGLTVSLSILVVVIAGIMVHSFVLRGQMEEFISLTDKARQAVIEDDLEKSSQTAQEILDLLKKRQTYLCATVDFGIVNKCEIATERIHASKDPNGKSNLLMDLAELKRLFETIKTSENFSFDNIF